MALRLSSGNVESLRWLLAPGIVHRAGSPPAHR
jgi:hypothetical protein